MTTPLVKCVNATYKDRMKISTMLKETSLIRGTLPTSKHIVKMRLSVGIKQGKADNEELLHE